MSTHPNDRAVDVALAYHRAWAAGDMDAAMEFVDDGIECLAPGGTIEGAAAFRGFMEPFSQMVLATQVEAAFGDDTQAVVVYDTRSRLVESGPGAAHVTVDAGRITHMRIVFDRLPFAEARASQG